MLDIESVRILVRFAIGHPLALRIVAGKELREEGRRGIEVLVGDVSN